MVRRDELQAATAMMWMISSSFTDAAGTATAAAYQAGRRRQVIMGQHDRVGDEPRLLIDFNARPPTLTARGEPVGERQRGLVTLMGEDYRLVRRWRWLPGLRFTASAAGRTVLDVRERRPTTGMVHSFDVLVAPDLDSVVALGLIVLEVRPDRMGLGSSAATT